MELSSDAIKWPEQDRSDVRGIGVAERCHSFVRAGWWLGKRLAIAGAAITSAPVVIPLLFIFSAIILAFSLPFTILFAGYAATNKVMGYLLSPPPTQLLLEGPVCEGEVRDMERYDLTVDGKVGGNEGKVFDEMPAREEEAEEVEMHPYVWDGEVAWGDGEKMLEEMPMEGEEMVDQVEPPVLMKEPMGIPVQVATAVVYPDVTVEFVQEGTFVDQFYLSPEYALGSETWLAPTEGPVDVEEVLEEALATVDVHVLSEENLYSMENIWEEIDALRTIVGYTATRLASSAEELKALYKFTGVEPPASLGEFTDLVEMRGRLQFLKSVVGVK